MSEHNRRGRPPKFGSLAEFGTPVETDVLTSKEFMAHAGYMNQSTTDQLKTLLKAIYNSGQLGIRRSLDKDMAALQAILEGKAGA